MGMVKYSLMVMLALIITDSNAQSFGLGFSTGKSFGILETTHEDKNEPFNRKHTLGSGISDLLTFNVYPDSSNWYFSFGLEYFRGSPAISASNSNLNFTYGANRTLKSFRMQTQLAYSFQTPYFDIDVKAGLLLPLVNRFVEESFQIDSAETVFQKSELELYPSFGFRGGLMIKKKLNRKLDFFINTDISLLSPSIKKQTVVAYSNSVHSNVNDAFPSVASREFLYRKKPTEIRNNTSVLPDTFDDSKPTDKLAYKNSFNAIGLRFGFIFHF